MCRARLVSVTLTLVACWCAGCDPGHSVSRTFRIDSPPSSETVELAIRATPGVTEVTREDVPTSEGDSLYKGKVYEPGYVQFTCRDPASFAAVELREDTKRERYLYVYSAWLGRGPNETELSNARALIDRICNSLHQRAPNIPASSPADDKFVAIRGH